jgi:3-dehydroquinate synthase
VSDAGDPSVSSVLVGSGAGAYPVLVGEGLVAHLPDLLREYAPAHRYAVVSDDNVAALYGEDAVDRCRRDGMTADLFSFPHGEASKTREQWSILTDRMLAAGLGRDAAMVALGGGVTGDLAGFVAATYLRGIPLVQVPTSMVAMVDASVGGKTGVDVRAGKNLVGAFHAPRVVLADPETTRTLPLEERAQGLAEAVKHGAILDDAYFDRLGEEAGPLMEGDVPATRSAVLRSVQIKARVVSEDERESGLRQILNFGHTLGHAIEAAASWSIGHGSAVAAGMVLEARLGEALGVTEAGTARRVTDTLTRFGLGTVPRGVVDEAAVLGFLGADKKARRGQPRYVLLERVGAVESTRGWSRDVPHAAVVALLAEAFGAETAADGVTT